MHDGFGDALSAWNNFYVILGSSSAALTGLVFIVITLISDGRGSRSPLGVSVFTTPSIVHFGCSLFIAAALCAPFRAPLAPALACVAVGLFGLAWTSRAVRLANKLDTYRPDLEDWIFHGTLPLVAYGALALGGVGFLVRPHVALYVPGAVALTLIFVGIHNAWDVVTYLATGQADALGDAPKTD